MARRGGYGEEEEDVDEEDDEDSEDNEEEESRWGRRRDGRREKRKGKGRRMSGRRRRHGRRGRGRTRGRGGHEEGEDTRKGRRRGGMEDEQQTTQAGSSGSVGSTVAQTQSQSAGIMASQPLVLTSDEIAIQQAALQEAQLQKALGDIKAEKERMIRRRARMQWRQADVSELEEMDLTLVTYEVRIVRSVLLNVVEMQDHQTTILQDIQQSLTLLVGQAQAMSPMFGPGAWPIVQPPLFVPPVTGVSPYVVPSSVVIVSLGMPLSGGIIAGSSLQVSVQTVVTQSPLQIAVTTQPAVSQSVQPQGTQPQQLAQQPVSQGPQPGVMQGPGQTQRVPKTTIAASKPFTGDKRGEDLDTWLRAVPVYVRCKLTLPHEEVLVAASYLEGSAARWLSGLVQLQGYGHDFRAWAGQTQWVPKTTIAAPKPFTGDKRGEDLDTWLRAVPVYVRCKLTLPHEEVLVAASYLEGSAARWLSGLVQLQGYGHDFRAWAVTQKLDDFLKLVEERWHDPQEPQRATDAILTLHTRQFKSVREVTDAVERLICVPGVRYDPQLDDNFQEGVGAEAGSVEASGGGVVAVVTQKGKATGRRRGGCQSRSQVDPNAPPWEKAGLTEDVWRDRYTRQACIRCGQYDHNQFKCRNKKVTDKIPPTMGQAVGSSHPVGSNVASTSGKHVGPVGIIALPTRVEVVETPSPSREMAQATDSGVVPQTRSDLSSLCSMNVFESLEELEEEWSRSDPLASWTALVKARKGEMFVSEVVIGGRKARAYYNTCSTRNFISHACVERLHLHGQAQRLSRPVESTCANKQRMVVNDYLQDGECCFPYTGGELRHHVSFLVSDELPMDMLLGMYYLSVAQPQFDWDRKVVKHTLPGGGTARLHKFKASSLIESHGCMCAAAFYNYYKQNQEEGMYLVYVSAARESMKIPPEIEGVVAKYPDLFEEPTGVVEKEVVHAIEIIPGSSIPKGRIYRMSSGELDELRRQLKELIEKGWIRPMTTDASQYGIGAVLAQQEGKKLRPVEYMSKKMPSQKLAKSTYEKELYAVYKALTHWRHYLLGRFFILRTDHQTMRWMRTQPVLSDDLKRWIEVIEQYDFEPQYIKGEYNKVADALSRRPDFSGALITEFGLADNVTQSMVESYHEDPFMSEIIRRLEAKDKVTSAEFELVNGLLFL
ncbi:hypothetical protein CBR_g8889 [Chara braunii]|uniref:Reverse transcriptase RNase H-like domain-containing protein n=1 Tax=Chara braunii TaxID=69332 RepID=A0A388KN40_CHABU|nr:hypothetical protein CBR_g8889 [Chara braunii]|eukprot:GBG71472.1 hypothetical protein CBR_g8889 [Chara braunii]